MLAKAQIEALCEASGKVGRDYLLQPSTENLKAFNEASMEFNEALQQLYRSGTLVFRNEVLEEAVRWLRDQDWNGSELQGTDFLAQEMWDALKSQEAE